MRIIEDKDKNFRGNHNVQMVSFDTANSLFVSQAQMTYKSLKSFALRLGKYFNATEIVILDEDYSKYLITVYEDRDDITGEYSYKFWHMPDDAKSVEDRIYYTKEDFQKSEKLERK